MKTINRPLELYQKLKKHHPDALLLFRMGDFYELFYTDAEIAAKEIGLTLTQMRRSGDDPVSMCGFPFHMLEEVRKKLSQIGYGIEIF